MTLKLYILTIVNIGISLAVKEGSTEFMLSQIGLYFQCCTQFGLSRLCRYQLNVEVFFFFTDVTISFVGKRLTETSLVQQTYCLSSRKKHKLSNKLWEYVKKKNSIKNLPYLNQLPQ